VIPAVVGTMCGHRCGQEVLSIVCLMIGEADKEPSAEIRRFETTNIELEKLMDWLVSSGCTHTVMESELVGTSIPLLSVVRPNWIPTTESPLKTKGLRASGRIWIPRLFQICCCSECADFAILKSNQRAGVIQLVECQLPEYPL